MIALALRYWWVFAIAAALAWGGAERMRGNNARADLATYKATAAESARLADRAQRTEEQRRQDAVTKEVTHAQTQTNTLEPDVRRAASAADGLRSAAVSTARRACPNPAPTASGPSQPDSDALDLLADVLGAVGERAAVYAEAADRARIAGAACERIYDAIDRR